MSDPVIDHDAIFGYGIKMRQCLVPAEKWNGHTGIPELLEMHRTDTLPEKKHQWREFWEGIEKAKDYVSNAPDNNAALRAADDNKYPFPRQRE